MPSLMMSPTFLRGFRLAIGSWKIICMSERSILRVSRSSAPEITLPLKVMRPSVGVYRRMMLRPMVVLPEPDSPTSP